MKKKFAELQSVENNDPISWCSHHDFLCHVQYALLLALFEQGRLSMSQLNRAEKDLQRRCRERLEVWRKGRRGEG